MTDGAWSYTHNRSLAELLSAHQVRQIVTPPYTASSNGFGPRRGRDRSLSTPACSAALPYS